MNLRGQRPLLLRALLAWGVAALALVGLRVGGADEAPRPPVVSRCVLDGIVDAGTGAYLTECVRRAEQAGHAALLVRVDTPGGSLDATRDIVRAFLGARVPVLVWVGPSGARAGSAGVFITLAAHRAAMAPGTHIGAASPVAGPTGEDLEEHGGKTLARKIENDTAAFAESIARERGRNARWAERAVRESVSVPAERAVELKVVDLAAPSEEDFLARVDGQRVELPDGPHTLATRDAQLDDLRPTLSQRLLHALAQPAVVYLLFLFATLGLVVELSHPGLVAPGVLGVVALVLALVASSALPVRAGALALLLLGAGLIVAELFVTSGLLGAAGTLLLVLGGLFLVDRMEPGWFVEPSVGLPLRLVLPLALVFAGMAVYVAVRGAQARRMPQRTGDAGMVGEKGTALALVSAEGGEVFVHGERWRAVSPQPLPKGTPVVVRRVEGLTLFVDEVTP
ncbi:NfeD family protein [Myxococcaceae bacterium GXIMD 01537]